MTDRRRKVWSRKFIFFTFFWWFLTLAGCVVAWVYGTLETKIVCSVMGIGFAWFIYAIIYDEHSRSIRWRDDW